MMKVFSCRQCNDRSGPNAAAGPWQNPIIKAIRCDGIIASTLLNTSPGTRVSRIKKALINEKSPGTAAPGLLSNIRINRTAVQFAVIPLEPRGFARGNRLSRFDARRAGVFFRAWHCNAVPELAVVACRRQCNRRLQPRALQRSSGSTGSQHAGDIGAFELLLAVRMPPSELALLLAGEVVALQLLLTVRIPPGELANRHVVFVTAFHLLLPFLCHQVHKPWRWLAPSAPVTWVAATPSQKS